MRGPGGAASGALFIGLSRLAGRRPKTPEKPGFPASGAKGMQAPDRDRQVAAFRRRLESMGLELRVVPGGHALLVRLPARGGPLAGLGPPLPLRWIVFATVGANRIKCILPRPLFHLPLLSVADCDDPAALEARVREAWSQRIEQLRGAREWLEKLGCAPDPPSATPILTLHPGCHDDAARAAVVEPGALVLPGRGPLSGTPLARPEDRVFRPDADVASAMDLELALTNRLEELARIREREARHGELRAAALDTPPRGGRAERHPLLLVGRRLLGDTGLIESLRVRGYRVTAVRGAREALGAFAQRSFELVLAESELDRFEGTELVPAIRALPGVEEIPLVIVDTHLRPDLRETARRVGAAGYVTHPVDLPLIEDGLERLLRAPRRRRFTRYARHLGVRAPGLARPEVTQQIGRGGMLLASDREPTLDALQRYTIALPDGGGPLRVDAAVVYRVAGTALRQPRLGLRFDGFPDNDEARLVAFLYTLENRA